MAGKSNLAATLFAQKKLLNKAMTSILKSDAQEVIGSNIQPAAQTTMGQKIPASPAQTLYVIQAATGSTEATVEYVDFTLTAIAGTVYDANAVDTGAGPEPSTTGPHAYKLILTGNYQSLTNNPSAGNGVFDNSKTVYTTLGALQIIPPNFSQDSPNPYTLQLYSGDPAGTGSQIPLEDEIDWQLDTYNGILFVQDYNSSSIPTHARAFMYVGKMLDIVIASGSGGSSSGGSGTVTRKKYVYDISSTLGSDTNYTATGTDFSKGGFDTNYIDIFVNGQLLTSGTAAEILTDTADYTISSYETLKFGFDLEKGDVLTTAVFTSGTVTSSNADQNLIMNQLVGGTVDGSNTKFTLGSEPFSVSSIQIFVNGQMQLISGLGASYQDFSVTGSNIYFTSASTPPAGSAIVASYFEK